MKESGTDNKQYALKQGCLSCLAKDHSHYCGLVRGLQV